MAEDRYLEYNGFRAKAYTGVRIHGRSTLRIEFPLDKGITRKEKVFNLSVVRTQQEFERIVEEANETAMVVRSLAKKGNLTDDLYRNFFPNSEYAKKLDENSSYTFNEVAEMYIESLEVLVSSAELAKSGYEGTRNFLRGEWLKEMKIGGDSRRRLYVTGLGGMRISEIKPADIQAFYDYIFYTARKPDGSRYSASYVNNGLSHIRAVFRYAINKKGMNISDVTATIQTKSRPRRQIHSLQLGTAAEDNEFFTVEERDTIYEYLLAHDKAYMAYMFMFAWHMGLSLGEVIGVAWEDISLENNGLLVRRAISGNQFKDPKEEVRFRLIGLVKPAKDALLAMKEITFDLEPVTYSVARQAENGFVDEEIRLVFLNFTSESNGDLIRPWTRSSLYKKWSSMGDETGIKKPFSWTRKSFAKYCQSRGIDDKAIYTHMGHVDAKMLNNVYGGMRLEFNPDLLNSMNKMLGYDS